MKLKMATEILGLKKDQLAKEQYIEEN